MNAVLSRMSSNLFRIEIFEERMILNDPIEVILLLDLFIRAGLLLIV